MPEVVTRRPRIVDALRQATAALHAEAEALVPLLRRDVSLADYRWFLERSLGFLGPLERALDAAHGATAPELELGRRAKRSLLEQDLRALGAGDAALAALPAARTPPVAALGAALGALYVVEGATLGGQVLLRSLRGRLPGIESASAYLHGYGGATGPMWTRLGAVLDRHARDEAALVAGAVATFAALVGWLRE